MALLIQNVLLNNHITDIRIDENRISRIAPEQDANGAEIIDGTNLAALPPFINAHNHAAMTVLRGYADDMVLQDWLQTKIWPFESKLTEEDVYWGTKFACLEMIKSGTTFFNDQYFFFNSIAQAVDDIGMRAGVGVAMLDFFDEAKTQELKAFAQEKFNGMDQFSSRVTFVLGPHSIYTVSEGLLRWTADFARQHNLMLHIHISETQQEVTDCIQQHGMRPIEWLDSIGFLGPNVIAAHMIWLDDNELSILQKHNVKIAHNPASNMKLSSGVLPAARLKEHNLTICLGTDGVASNNNLDMIEEMKLASLLQKVHFMDCLAAPADDVFAWATSNGAEVFGLDCGTVHEGGLADLILVDLNDINLTPNHNLISNMVYAANGTCVHTTICDGRVLMHNRHVAGEEEIVAQFRRTVQGLLQR
jgi:5-methylthioadenosine/S-adenosylhomocysteine deaminase